MNIEKYKDHLTSEILMGPDSARILGELLEKHPLGLSENDTVLDLGCGKGLTSFVLASETEAKVYASDLWITAEENRKRFSEWGVSDRIVPFCEDANELSFEKGLFDALVSVDAYHYFGTKKGFFAEKILPFLNDGAEVLIGIPGIKEEFSGKSEELLSLWLGNEAGTFRSPENWKEIIGVSDRIGYIETWEMECFDEAWDDWLKTGNEYAEGDKRFYESHIRPYSCLVGIYVKLK